MHQNGTCNITDLTRLIEVIVDALRYPMSPMQCKRNCNVKKGNWWNERKKLKTKIQRNQKKVKRQLRNMENLPGCGNYDKIDRWRHTEMSIILVIDVTTNRLLSSDYEMV